MLQVPGGLDDAMTTDRLEAFSDGVLAVIITLTAFEIRIPHGTDATALRHLVAPLLVYLLSFTYVGIYWNNHHHMFRRTQRISAAVMWANLYLLFCLSLVPFLTGWVAANYQHTEPAAAYGVAALAAAVAYTVLVRCIIGANGGPQGEFAVAIGKDVKGRASLAVYGLGVAMAFVTPYLAYALYACVAIMWFVPDRRLAS
jgi:TMEM175 potassium channel family protein